MNNLRSIAIIIAVFSIIICITLTLLQRRKMKRILRTLDSMLNRAIDGNFTENLFDESLLSAVESKLNHYLTASCVSSQNVKIEKEKVKELVADISHQTKTPIANILLYAQLLEEVELPNESLRYVDALRTQAEKLNFLVSALVKVSRLETGVFVLQPKLNAVAPMLQEVVQQYLPDADKKQIEIILDSSSAYAVFDYKWTIEACANLVDNAIKYTPMGGRIKVSVQEYDLFCRIDISDSGVGISEFEQAKVFLRFYRSPSVHEEQGVGIGLYLTRQILAEQGGYIKLQSHLGEGTVFSIFLPRAS